MASPALTLPYERPPIVDVSLQLTPTPAENYRCPVSTPANFVQRYSRIRRTRPMVEVPFSQPPLTGGKPQRSNGMALSRHSRSARESATRVPLSIGNSLKYYFVDQQGDQKEDEETNTHWLKALCSQPVEEILNKYRRKSDVKRTRIIWCKTFTTPGERSLLSAWENNIFYSKSRGRDVKSEYVARSSRLGTSFSSPKRQKRQTQSEPPLSRAQNLDLPSGTVSPASGYKEVKTPVEPPVEHPKIEVMETWKDSTPRKKVPETLLNDPSRVTSYVTQYFVPKGKGPVYGRVLNHSPEMLPKMSNRQKIANMNKERYTDSYVAPNLVVSSNDGGSSPVS